MSEATHEQLALGSHTVVFGTRPLLVDATAVALGASGIGLAASAGRDAQRGCHVAVIDCGRDRDAAGRLVETARAATTLETIVLVGDGPGWGPHLASQHDATWLDYEAPPDRIMRVVRGEAVVRSSERAGRAPAPGNHEQRLLTALTPRERELLDLLGRGLTNRGIAEHLAISPHTVRTHVQNLTAKLGVRSRLEAVALARRASTEGREQPGRVHPLHAVGADPDVVVAFDAPFHRWGLEAVLARRHPGLTVHGAPGTTPLLADLTHGGCRVVLLDGAFGGDGVGICRRLKALDDPPAVLVLADQDDPGLLSHAVHSGADGFVAYDADLDELDEAIARVLTGEAYVPPQMLGTLLRDLIRRRREEDAAVDRFARLSRRERQVLGLLASGLDQDTISERLFLSPHTARTHIQNVLRKLEVHSRLEAVSMALQHGFLERFDTGGPE